MAVNDANDETEVLLTEPAFGGFPGGPQKSSSAIGPSDEDPEIEEVLELHLEDLNRILDDPTHRLHDASQRVLSGAMKPLTDALSKLTIPSPQISDRQRRSFEAIVSRFNDSFSSNRPQVDRELFDAIAADVLPSDDLDDHREAPTVAEVVQVADVKAHELLVANLNTLATIAASATDAAKEAKAANEIAQKTLREAQTTEMQAQAARAKVETDQRRLERTATATKWWTSACALLALAAVLVAIFKPA